jgi:hypothetical protein
LNGNHDTVINIESADAWLVTRYGRGVGIGTVLFVGPGHDPGYGTAVITEILNGSISIQIIIADVAKAGIRVTDSRMATTGTLSAKGSQFSIDVPDELRTLSPAGGAVQEIQGLAYITGAGIHIMVVENMVGTTGATIIVAGTLYGHRYFTYDAESGDGTLEHLFSFQTVGDSVT